MRTKYFYYFQGLRVLRCHWTKRSNRVNYQSKWPLQKTISSLTPLLPGFPGSFTPPSRENFQNPIGQGGADFFWNNPFSLTPVMYLFQNFIYKQKRPFVYSSSSKSTNHRMLRQCPHMHCFGFLLYWSAVIYISKKLIFKENLNISYWLHHVSHCLKISFRSAARLQRGP